MKHIKWLNKDLLNYKKLKNLSMLRVLLTLLKTLYLKQKQEERDRLQLDKCQLEFISNKPASLDEEPYFSQPSHLRFYCDLAVLLIL